MKEHIKEYGHYGPHSARDRPRRPGERLYTIHVIKARYEEWTVDENGDSQPRRKVQSCEYNNSFKTKLWHTDVPGDMFWRGDEEGARDGHACPVEGCYFYYRGPPDGCEKVLFKTLKGLQEHYRRSHESSRSGPSLATLLGEKEIHSVADRSSSSTDSYSASTLSLSSGSSFSALGYLGSSFNTFGADRLKGAEWSEWASSFCVAGEESVCYCQSCCQRGTNIPQHSEATHLSCHRLLRSRHPTFLLYHGQLIRNTSKSQSPLQIPETTTSACLPATPFLYSDTTHSNRA